MDKDWFRFNSTKINKIIFDRDNFKDEIDFNVEITHLITTNENDEVTKIKVEGILNGLNTGGETIITIEGESIFDCHKEISEATLEKYLKEESDYFNSPILNEMSYILTTISHSFLNVPIILPLETSGLVKIED